MREAREICINEYNQNTCIVVGDVKYRKLQTQIQLFPCRDSSSGHQKSISLMNWVSLRKSRRAGVNGGVILLCHRKTFKNFHQNRSAKELSRRRSRRWDR